MKRISILFILLVTVLLISKAQNKDWEKPCLSPDGTMVYEYCDDDFVIVRRVNRPTILKKDLTTAPWWLEVFPNPIIEHWKKHGEQIDVILDKLNIEKRSLCARFVISLHTLKLATMSLSVNGETVHVLDQLPLGEIFSIYENLEPSQYITIYKHKPCKEDNMYITVWAICR